MTLSDRVPTLLSRARALLGLAGGPPHELSPPEIAPAARAVLELHKGLVGDRALAKPSTYAGKRLGAYLLWWWPQTYAKTQSVLRLAPMPQQPRILDVGSGAAPAALAAIDLLGGDATCFDASVPALREAQALGAARTTRELPQEEFDLSLAANVLSELPDAAALVRQLRGTLVLIEPALRETGRALLQLRDLLLASGQFRAVAPCLTQKRCPALLSPRDWCTLDARWEPPRHFIQLADATGLRADERLSFAALVLAPEASPPEREVWRVVGDAPPEKGKKRVWVCSDEGRLAAVLLDRHAAPQNADFGTLRRGDLVRLRGTERRGDGLRLVPGAAVERL